MRGYLAGGRTSKALPEYEGAASQISVVGGQPLALGVTRGSAGHIENSTVNVGQNQLVACAGTSGQKERVGGPGRIRTYDQGIMSPPL